MEHPENRSDRSTSDSSGQVAVATEPAEALFVYGTLLFPEVLRSLIGRVPDMRPASVVGWRVAALEGRSYPGLVPADGTAEGALITDLSADDWQVIDAYEGVEYEVRTLDVDGIRALVYLCTGEMRPLESTWDRQRFAAIELASFVESCAEWRSQYVGR